MIEIVQLSDIIFNLKTFFNLLLKKSKVIILVISITSVLSYFYWVKMPNIYTAKSTFIVEESNSKGGGLSGIASQFGFDVGSLLGGGGSGLFSGENIFEIINSRLIIEKVLLSKIDSENKKTLADLYIDSYKYKSKINEINNIDFSNINDTHTIFVDSVLDLIYKDILKNNLIIEKQNKKSSLITIQVKSNNQKFSKLFAERILSQTSELYISIKTKNLSKTIDKIQSKADSLQASLNILSSKSFNESKALQIINSNAAFKINTTQEEVTTRDKTVTYTLYAEVIKNLETLKLTLINQTPAIQVLDTPKYPLINQKINLLVVIFIGVLSSLLISIFYFLLKYLKYGEI